MIEQPYLLTEDRETEDQLDGPSLRRRSQFYPDEVPIISPMSRAYLTRPKPGFGKVVTRSEFEGVKDILDAAIICTSRHEVSIHTLMKRVARLEELNRVRTQAQLKAVSDQNVEVLRKMFHLSPIEKEDVQEDAFVQMHGMLHEYSEEGVDSVELLRRSREE